MLSLLPPEVSPEFAKGFIQSVSPRYLATNSAEWIAKHLAQAQAADALPASVTVMQSGDPHVELAVVADDEPGVLAKICATLSARKIKVVSAQIHSWLDPRGQRRVLDLFWVRAGQDPALVLQSLPKINQQLTDLVRGKLRGRTSPEEITLFKSVGASIEDLAAAVAVYEHYSA